MGEWTGARGRMLGLAAALAAVGGLAARAPAAPQEGDAALRADIEAIVRPLLESEELVGVVVGVVDGSGRRAFGLGAFERGSRRAPDGDTLFEVGSITKVFTGVLLAQMALDGAVKLEDPVASLLPRSVKVPRRGERAITLLDLATHTSGLPRMPDNLPSRDPARPYVGYTPAMLYAFLAKVSLERDPGAEYAYSNLGAGLLGHALALRSRRPYEELVLRRICEPCGLRSARFKLDAALERRLAPGHDESAEPTPGWDLAVLAPAGGLRASANDLLAFAAANLDLSETPLAAALESAREPRFRREGLALGLGWHWIDGGKTVFHNGGTGGYRSFLGLDPERKLAVVVLSNCAADVADAVGGALIKRLRGGPVEPPRARPNAKVDAGALDGLAGTYRLAPGADLAVTVAEGRLHARLTGQRPVRFFPESPERFRARAVEAELHFQRDPRGRATAVTLRQNGRDQEAKRVR